MKKKIATILTAAVIGATAFTTIVSAASGDITVQVLKKKKTVRK